MRGIRYVIHLILIMALLASGLPPVISGDMNGDDKVGLADAVLSVRGFSMTAENPQHFTAQVEQVVNALHIAAGLKTAIKPLDSEKSVNKTVPLNHLYVVSGDSISIFLPRISTVSEESLSYTSIIGAPAAPPPRTA